MTKEEQLMVAKLCDGVLADGQCNWLGDFNQELRKSQFNILFKNDNKAKAAIDILSKYGTVTFLKTPKYVNVYFKCTANILMP